MSSRWLFRGALAVAGAPLLAAAFELEPVWARMVDDDGRMDVDLPTPQSCENAEFSPDGQLIATVAKGDFTTRLLRAADGEEQWRRKESGETECVTFTRDGRHIVTGGENNALRVRRVSDGEVVADLPVGASVEGLRFSPDHRFLASGDEHGRVRIWDTSAGDPSAWPREPLAVLVHGKDAGAGDGKGHEADVNQVDWTRDGQRLISGGRNRLVREWDVASALAGREALVATHGPLNGSVKAVRISPDGTLLAAGCGHSPGENKPAQVGVFPRGEGRARIFDFPDFQVFETVTWTPEGAHLIAGGDVLAGGEKGYLATWRTSALAGQGPAPELRRIPVHNQEYLIFSPDGRHLLTSHQDGSVRLWRYRP